MIIKDGKHDVKLRRAWKNCSEVKMIVEVLNNKCKRYSKSVHIIHSVNINKSSE